MNHDRKSQPQVINHGWTRMNTDKEKTNSVPSHPCPSVFIRGLFLSCFVFSAFSELSAQTEGKKERFRPNYGAAALLVTVSSNAPATSVPQMLNVWARPVLNGKIGAALAVQTLPFTI